MQKRNICFIIDNFLERGGTECQLAMLIDHLDRNRVEPFLVLLNGDEETSGAMVPKNCPVFYYDVKRIFSIHGLKKALEFRRFLKKNKIDLIQTYFPDSTLFASIVGKISGVPVIFGSRRNIGHWMKPRDRWTTKFLHRFFIDKIIANAKACKQAVIEQENAKPENVVVIPNGIETERFDSIPTWTPGSINSPFRIGAVGNYNQPVKGVDILIDAAKIVLEKFPDISFEIAGTGDFERYNKQITDCGIADRFKLLGSLADIPGFLRTLDIAVLPSRAEGLSNGLLEYMAAGRPAIATDVGGNGELIEHERNGLLVPSENPQALADAICDLIEHPERAARFAAEARSDVTDKYDATKVAELHSEIYEKELANKKRNRV